MLADGTGRCWGSDALGQAGTGEDGRPEFVHTPMPIDGLHGITQIDTSGFHTCARLASGNARCWGLNADGQLGDGTTLTRDWASSYVVEER